MWSLSLFVFLILLELDDKEVDKLLATSSKIDDIKGAFSSKRGDTKGDPVWLLFVVLSFVSGAFSLFSVVEHSGTSREINEARVVAGVLSTGKLRFDGLDFRVDFLLFLRKFLSRSNSKRVRLLGELLLSF